MPRHRRAGGRAEAAAAAPPAAQAPLAATLSGGSYGTVTFDLKAGQGVMAAGGAMLALRGDVAIASAALGAGWVGRLFAGGSLTLPVYRAGAGGGSATFGGPLPGAVLELAVPPDRELIVTQGGFLAGSEGLLITAKLNARGILGLGQEEGVALMRVANPPGATAPGRVWLCAFGEAREEKLAAGQKLRADNGTFLCRLMPLASKEPAYTLERAAPGLLVSLLSGEGLVMGFEGGAAGDTVHLQTRNFNDLARRVLAMGGAAPAPAPVAAAGVVGSVVGAFFGSSAEAAGGGRGRAGPKKAAPKTKAKKA